MNNWLSLMWLKSQEKNLLIEKYEIESLNRDMFDLKSNKNKE